MPATVELHAGWHARRVDATPLSGEQLSAGPVDPAGWIRAIVPGTVLTTLLADRAWLEAHVPAEVLAHSANRAGFDPFWGDNARHLPDLGDRAPRDGPFRKGRGRELYTYWLRTEFHLDAALRGDERLWLELRGASYTVAVYLNGRRLEGPPEKGMFLRRVYDATGAIRRDGANALAVRVEPVDHPGTFCDINGADGEIGRNVATQYTSGWDWVPAIPDRHTGLWDRVALHSTGPVRLQDPHVITRVPGVRDPDGPQAPARLTIAATLHNASDAAQSGQLRAESDGTAVAQPVVVLPRETRTVRFAPEVFPQLVLSQPRLWWPNGMGPPSLYDLRLAFALDDGRLSDETRLRFGIRQIRSEVPAGMERVFYVNGRRVFVRGGNWVGTDALPHPVVRRDGVRLPADAYTPLFRLRRPRGLSTVHFLRLELRAGDGALVADNLYWFSRKRRTAPDRYAALEALRERPADLAATVASVADGDGHTLRASLRHDGSGVAFCIRLKLLRGDGVTRVLPAFYTDNYLTLFAGEARQVDVTCTARAAGGQAPRLFVEGWNLASRQIA